MREKSERCKQKMTKPFCGTTVADITLKKIEKLENVVVPIYKGDKKLRDIASSYNINIIDRSKSSVTIAKKCNEINSYLDDFKESYVLWINASAPFIKVSTINNIKRLFYKSKKIESIHLIEDYPNWVWMNNKPINIKNLNNTRLQEREHVYSSIHCLHLYNREYMMRTGSYWKLKPNNPYLLKLPHSFEFYDIDTEEDFLICSYIYENYEKC